MAVSLKRKREVLILGKFESQFRVEVTRHKPREMMFPVVVTEKIIFSSIALPQ